MTDLYQRLANLSQAKRALLARRLDGQTSMTSPIKGERELKRLVGYIVARQGQAPTAVELRSFLSEKLPEHMIPAAFVMLEGLPLTPSGKIDRRSLPGLEQTGQEIAERYIAPRTATEELLCGIWTEVLKVERVGVEDNFFELGGHSLLATQVMAQVREVFGVEVEVRRLFEHPTVVELASSIEAEMGMGQSLVAPPIERAARGRDLPLS